MHATLRLPGYPLAPLPRERAAALFRKRRHAAS